MNKVNRKFFVAYGSLMNVDKMALVCPESYIFGWGSLRSFESEFRTLEILEESAKGYLPFALWSITEADEISLDSFFDLEIYRKDELKVILTDVNDLVAPYYADYYRDGIKGLVYVKKDVDVEKPKAALVGANGNIFNLIGIASQALKRTGQHGLAKEMHRRISTEAKSYDEAIQIIMQYVEVE